MSLSIFLYLFSLSLPLYFSISLSISLYLFVCLYLSIYQSIHPSLWIFFFVSLPLPLFCSLFLYCSISLLITYYLSFSLSIAYCSLSLSPFFSIILSGTLFLLIYQSLTLIFCQKYFHFRPAWDSWIKGSNLSPPCRPHPPGSPTSKTPRQSPFSAVHPQVSNIRGN